MQIALGTFRGELPRIEPHLLPEDKASYALDCNYDNGNLKGLYQPLLLSGSVKSSTKTLFRYLDSHWFSWNVEVDAVNSPIPKDPYQRVYLTGLDVPRYTTQAIAIGATLPNATVPLGIPKPTVALTGSVQGDGSGNEDDFDDETRFYVYTWVSNIGEEGPPSDPSTKFTLIDPDNQTVALNLPALAVNDRNIAYRRIYRTATSGDTTEFYLCAEIPVANTTHTDTVLSADLSVLLSTTQYFPPPDDMKGLTSLSNGVLIGFDGNILCPSEPNLPYAYDPNNQLALDENIVAIGALPTGAVIATEGQPYLLQGYTPDSYSLIKLETSAPCVSSRSMVDMGSFVIYATPEGLVMVGNGEPQLVTRSLMTKEQWQAWNPETLHAYQYGDKYVGFTDQGGFILDPQEPDMTRISFTCDAGFRLPKTETLILSDNTTLYEFDSIGNSSETFVWRSKEYKTKPMVFSAAKATGTNVTVKIIRDGLTVHTSQTVNGELVYRLPPGYGSVWQIEVSGTGELDTFSFATSVQELI